ncbi:MAG: methyltransferase [Candidatus Aminicenantes bacterium]|nr:methyltransferase [Candidatus Aminicenantes bacterium]
MNSRDRIQAALQRRPSDRIPLDLGGTAVSGIHAQSVARLRDRLGLEKKPVKVIEPYQMLGEVEQDLKDILGIDTAAALSRNTMFGFPNKDWKEVLMPWGQVVLVPGDFNTTRAEDGSLLMHPEGDTSVPPCAKMPPASYFFDALSRQDSLSEKNLNPKDNLEEFNPVSDKDLIHWIETVSSAAAEPGKDAAGGSDRGQRAVVATFGGTAFGDIALVPGLHLKHPRGIRDVTEWYLSTLIRTDYLHRVFEGQCSIALHNLEKIHFAVGDAVDVVFICGTDFGTQDSQFCSPETFDSLYAPYYKRINEWIHDHTAWKTFKHSCGAVEPLIERFIEVGFDILNPVQISAGGMDPATLKEKYGDRIVFWGGGVDTQRTLPFGTPEEVERQVLNMCKLFSPGGGFVFNTVHNIQADVPVENIVAMINAVKRFNGEQPLTIQ